MAWWTSTDKFALHPKTKSRFVLVIGSYLIPTIKTVTKPSVAIDVKEFRMINHYYKYPGLVKWNPITLTFVDGAGEYLMADRSEDLLAGGQGGVRHMDTATLLSDMLGGSNYKTPDNSGLTTPTKASMMDLSFQGSVFIQQINTVPNEEGKLLITEQWEIVNPIIKSINWGDLAYESDDLVEYTMDIEYDYAKFSSPPFIEPKYAATGISPVISRQIEQE